jgi:hypothetical protein
MSEVTVIEMPQPLGLFAGQLFDRGVEYLEAFEILSGGGVRKYHPSYFLCGLALYSPSFLRTQVVRAFVANSWTTLSGMPISFSGPMASLIFNHVGVVHQGQRQKISHMPFVDV